jgi:hypothetical protein
LCRNNSLFAAAAAITFVGRNAFAAKHSIDATQHDNAEIIKKNARPIWPGIFRTNPEGRWVTGGNPGFLLFLPLDM